MLAEQRHHFHEKAVLQSGRHFEWGFEMVVCRGGGRESLFEGCSSSTERESFSMLP